MVDTAKDTPSWFDRNIMSFIREMQTYNSRKVIHQVFNLLLVVSTALMIWQALILSTGSVSPVVVVLSGSMEPTFYKGDILTLYKDDVYTVGDIVVFEIPGREIPIVHRVLEVHYDDLGEQTILTKGDNNQSFDRPLYDTRQMWLKKEHMLGTVKGFLPYVGYVTIWLSEFPVLKYVMLGIMGFCVLTSKEG